MSRETDWTHATLTHIIDTATWLRTHTPDLYELAYGPSSSSDSEHVQQSGTRDLSDRIGRPAQTAWHTTVKAVKAALVELERAEYACNSTFTAGTLPDPDRPGRDTTMPRRIQQQVHQAAARRRQRGEWAPTPLGDT